MERWDFDCQKCERNIGDAWYVNSWWYQCDQQRGEYNLLKEAFRKHIKTLPSFTFDSKGNVVEGCIPDDEELLKRSREAIKAVLEKNYPGYNVQGDVIIYVNLKKKRVWWSPKAQSEFDDENYKRAGIVKHKVKGRGWGRLGYCFCRDCVEKLGYRRCPICGSKLIKISADQHPGGHWGIRGGIQEPASMRG